MAKPPRGRPFQKGQSGNPGGRPKGSKNVKALVHALVIDPVLLEGDTIARAQAAFRDNLTRARTNLNALETAGKFTGELGRASGDSGGGVTIVFASNVRPERLEAMRVRALPVETVMPTNGNGHRNGHKG